MGGDNQENTDKVEAYNIFDKETGSHSIILEEPNDDSSVLLNNDNSQS